MKTNTKYKLLMWGIVIGGAGIATLLFLLVFGPLIPNGFSFLIYAAMVFGAVFLMLHVGKVYSRHITKRINDILDEECDPEKYLAAARDLWGKSEGSGRISYQLYLVNGLIFNGQYQEAKDILETVTKFPDSPYGKQLKAGYLYGLFNIAMLQEEAEKVEAYFKEYVRSLDEIKYENERNRQAYERSVLMGRTALNVKEGIYDDAEETYLRCFKEADKKLTRIESRYGLGKIYLHFKRYDEAKDAFNYVIENGNKLHAVTLAKEQLAKIG